MRTIGSTFYIAILDEFKIDMEISLFWGTVYDLSERNLLNVTQIWGNERYIFFSILKDENILPNFLFCAMPDYLNSYFILLN